MSDAPPGLVRAYGADPLGRQGKLLPVRVAEFVKDLDRSRVWIDLVGLDEGQVRQRLLAESSRNRETVGGSLPSRPAAQR